MLLSARSKVTLSTGLALFAMFFGAGNMIFPLKVGALSGEHVTPALIAFIISGVGVPFLGIFAVSLYEGDYWKFFRRISKPLAFAVVTFLILIIGPLFAAPRTEIITFNTLLPMLPGVLKNQYLFSALYFLTIFLLIKKQSRIVDIIGWLFSPLKIICFLTLIVIGVCTAVPFLQTTSAATQTFSSSLTTGYDTMDLLAAFFFCSVAYKNIVYKSQLIGITSQASITKMMLFACLIGAGLISLIYAGFIYVAASHAQALANTPTEALIGKIASVTLGQYGELFVGICVSIACLATGATLAEVTTDYLYNTCFRQKLARIFCLSLVMLIMGLMSILGFDGIMKIAGPILDYLYPALIVLCVVNIYFKLVGKKLSFKLNFSPKRTRVSARVETE